MSCSREKRYQALHGFSVLQATESWAGPGNEASITDGKLFQLYTNDLRWAIHVYLSCKIVMHITTVLYFSIVNPGKSRGLLTCIHTVAAASDQRNTVKSS